jgi:hypothetical protein
MIKTLHLACAVALLVAAGASATAAGPAGTGGATTRSEGDLAASLAGNSGSGQAAASVATDRQNGTADSANDVRGANAPSRRIDGTAGGPNGGPVDNGSQADDARGLSERTRE